MFENGRVGALPGPNVCKEMGIASCEGMPFGMITARAAPTSIVPIIALTRREWKRRIARKRRIAAQATTRNTPKPSPRYCQRDKNSCIVCSLWVRLWVAAHVVNWLWYVAILVVCEKSLFALQQITETNFGL